MFNPYPKILVDETSGIEVSNNDYYVWEDGFEAGMREVVEWLEKYKKIKPPKYQLKEWGIEK